MKLALKLVVLTLTLLLAGGAHFFYLPISHGAQFQANEEITLLFYGEEGIKKRVIFPPHSDMHKKLNRWLKTNDENWHHSVVSFAPTIYFLSKGIALNFKEDFTVINYSQLSKDRHTQIVKEQNFANFKNELLQENL